MASVLRLVLDVLKPHDPDVIAFARAVAAIDGVAGATVSLVESDRVVDTVKLTVEGDDVDPDAVEAVVDDLGGSVHSVDEVSCGERLVTERATPQDGR